MVGVLRHTLIASPGHDPQHRLAIFHGAFGAGRNWGVIARRLVDARPDWGVVLPDLRLHGDSQGFSAPHTLQAAASDVATLAQMLGVSLDAVLGHSLGGKVALLYARPIPPGLQQVWVVDAAPGAGPPSGSAWQMLQAVRALPTEFVARQDAAAGLVRLGFAPDVAQWMTTNLERTGRHYRWRLDFAALEDLLRSFFQTDIWNIVTDPPAGITLHFIKATDSDAIDEDSMKHLDRIATGGQLSVHVVQGGHWIHADNPDGVVKLLVRYLP